VMGVMAHWRGDPMGATRHLEAALDAYRPEHAHEHINTFGQDPSPICGVRLAHALWMIGQSEPARVALTDAVARAKALGHPHTLAYARTWGARLLIDIGDEAGARRQLDGAIEAEANAFSGWSIRNRALHGFLLAHEGKADRGIELMRSAAEEWASRGFRSFVPCDRALLAQACLAAGRLEEGFRAIEEGTAVARETGQSFWDAELLRLRGELLAASGAPPPEVRRLLQEAIDVATRQGAIALVRRAERSLQLL
jgi:tetratricopeptide (TPR) repeat protein